MALGLRKVAIQKEEWNFSNLDQERKSSSIHDDTMASRLEECETHRYNLNLPRAVQSAVQTPIDRLSQCTLA